MKTPLTKERALLLMADLCSRSEHCSFEIEKKLISKGLSRSDIAEIIGELSSRGFIDNERFARAFANDKIKFSGWGRYKIRMALIAKHIPSDVISPVLSSVDIDEYMEKLHRITKAKMSGMDMKDKNERIKLYRHLITRGFESDLVTKKIRQLLTE